MTLAPSLRALVDFRSFHRTRRNRANVVMQSSKAKDLYTLLLHHSILVHLPMLKDSVQGFIYDTTLAWKYTDTGRADSRSA